ncbi:MAG: DNA gyrase subunit A [Desulfobulbaceae bacterium A2]|nr:MAG: DNA gyrase subunit A [Desulfobulbaceae bacterium A2]
MEPIEQTPQQPHVAIEKELRKSYLEYAMSVIVGRALPDVRDGLKPVHRRTLFAMRELNNLHNRPYVKSARIVGDVIGKYHPHGDTAVYDTLVRMAQDFSMRYPLVDGQGNFGSLDGDAPAAMRYTEARMTRLDQELVADLDKETVDFVPNYDNSLSEPLVLPSRVPNILVNGSSGIAVGMATNIPPHNLTEVMNGLIALVEEPQITVHRLMEIITGPDFPTGGFICGRAGIREAYETGRGSVIMRSRTHVEKHKKSDFESIIITEIPYQQNKASLVERIAVLIKDKKIQGITEVRDESDRHGLRVVLELRKDEIPDIVLNQLYTLTPLQKNFGIILLCIVNNRPEVLNIKQILEYFLLHRKSVIYRRTVYELRKAEERAHLLEGLKVALSNIDEVVELIKRSGSPAEARIGLMQRFELSELQAQTILDMRLQRLTGLERDKILAEYEELVKKITWYRQVLADDALVLGIVRDEFIRIRDEYGDERRTEIIDSPDEILPEDLIAPEEMVVTITQSGFIKRNPVALYRSQRRGGKGVKGMTTIEEDGVIALHVASTLDTFLFFTNRGKVFWRKVYELPLAGRVARGKAIVNLLDLEAEEKVAAILPVARDLGEDDSHCLLMVTKSGRVKKTSLSEFRRPLRRGKRALTINEGDEILSADITSGQDEILLVSRQGQAIRFCEDNIRTMGREAAGVRGMTLAEDDEIAGSVVLRPGVSLLTITANGFGKRSEVDEYRVQRRGGSGVITIKTSDRNGPVVGALQVEDEDQVMLVTDCGKMIRMPMDSLRVIGRNTQGVRLFNLQEGERVVGLSKLARESVAVEPLEDDGDIEESSGEDEA